MKVTRGSSKPCAIFILALTLGCGAAMGGQTQGAGQNSGESQATPLIRSVEGQQLFRAYCATCHGLDGKGGGPAAAALKAKVPDLTLLTMNNQGKFPAARVRETIIGESGMAAHGSREMPIWGPVFHQIEEDVDRGNVRMQNLVEYIRSIQTIEITSSSNGEELYKQLCAACHANDLKGNGPAPYPYKDVPPDLTTLAQRHGGVFPGAYVASVLRNGVTMPAHGPAEMPIWGLDFRAANGLSADEVKRRIADLTSYIRVHQTR